MKNSLIYFSRIYNCFPNNRILCKLFFKRNVFIWQVALMLAEIVEVENALLRAQVKNCLLQKSIEIASGVALRFGGHEII